MDRALSTRSRDCNPGSLVVLFEIRIPALKMRGVRQILEIPMLVKLTFDHSALKDEAKKRGYEEQDFTEWIYCRVPGYRIDLVTWNEPWAVSDLSDVEFIYCNEPLTIELAIIEGDRLILWHDCDRYPDSPIKVWIKSIRSQEKSLSISGGKL